MWRSATLMTWLGLAVRFGGLAILVPLALVRLDVAQFLVWQILSTIAAFTGLADFGLQPTFARLIAFVRGGGALRASTLGGDHDDELSKLLTEQREIYAVVACVATLGILLCGLYFLSAPIDQLNSPSSGWGALVATALASFITVLNGSKASALLGFNLVATMRGNELVVSLLQLASTALVIAFTADVLFTVVCYSAWTVPLYFLNSRRLNVAITTAGANSSTRDRTIRPIVWSSAWRSGLGIAMSFGVIQFLALTMARSESPANAAGYLLALRIVTALSQVAQAPFYSKLPIMAALRGAGDHRALISTARRSSRLAHWTYAIGGGSVLVLMPTLLTLVGTDVPPPEAGFMAALVLALFFERYVGMHIQIYSLTGKIIWHKLNFAVGFVAVGLYLILHPIVGASAFPLALLGGYLGVGTLPISIKSTASLGDSWLAFEKRSSLVPGALLSAACAWSWWAAIRPSVI